MASKVPYGLSLSQSENTVTFAKFGWWSYRCLVDFILSLGLGVNQMEDIVLVTGRHLTKSWINVAFNRGTMGC